METIPIHKLVSFFLREAVIVCVKNVSGFISVDKDGRWVCTGGHKTERLPNPVSCKSVLIAF